MNNYFFPLRLSSSSFFFFLPSPITFFIILSFSLSLSLSPSLSLHRLLELYHVITSREKSKDRVERVSIRVKQNSGSRAAFLSLSLSLVSRFLGFFVGLRKGSRRGCRDYCYVSMSGDIRNILPTHLCLGRRPAGFLISHANCPDVPRNREEISVIISRTEAASSLPPEIGSISCLGEFEYTRGYVSVSARSKLQGLWKQPLENWPN